jgi:hypothetical protein
LAASNKLTEANGELRFKTIEHEKGWKLLSFEQEVQRRDETLLTRILLFHQNIGRAIAPAVFIRKKKLTQL